jgi:hypothetical protein
MNAKKLQKSINSNELLISKKLETNKLAEMLIDTELSEIGHRMLQSGKFIKTIQLNGKAQIIDSFRSGIRFEPYDNYCERRKVYSRFLNNLPLLIDKYPNHKWYFVTLTTKNCDVFMVRDRIKILNNSFKKLILDDKFSRYFKQNGEEYGNSGYFKNIEISECEHDDMMCRPHLHILFHFPPSFSFSKNYISKNTLQRLWQLAINHNLSIDYQASVTIEKIDYKDIDKQIFNLADTGSYIVKHEINLLRNKEFTVQYINQIHNEKLFSKAGTLRNITKKIKNNNDIEVNEDDIKMFKYQDLSSKYEYY